MKGMSLCPRDAIKVGELEKRSESLLQLWKRKHCTLTRDSLVLAGAGAGAGSGSGGAGAGAGSGSGGAGAGSGSGGAGAGSGSGGAGAGAGSGSGGASSGSSSSSSSGGGKTGLKELSFGTIHKLECVERKGARVYFTIVTTDQREIDFRCRDDSSWNAAITLALVAYKNQQAVRESHARKPTKRWRGWAA